MLVSSRYGVRVCKYYILYMYDNLGATLRIWMEGVIVL